VLLLFLLMVLCNSSWLLECDL